MNPLDDLAQKLMKEHPVLMVMLGLVALQVLSKPGERPAHLKGLPPIHPRTAGTWRGKGSFGHGFGPQVRHR